MEFTITEAFYIDGKKTTLVSGAVHYFRIAPTHWRRTLVNLKNMGCNCVETYVPWNLHEPRKGHYQFSGLADLESFLTLAQELGLYLIVRPSPYICAEWEFGGLPAWLLADSSMRIRSQYPPFLQAVSDYYRVLLPKLVPFQWTEGGSLLMLQVENEYGSFGADKDYLQALVRMLRNGGITVPLFTSDGGWEEVLEAGTLPEVLATVNFGSKAQENFAALQAYQERHQVSGPLMCMEFWDGWFTNWGEPLTTRSPEEAAAAAKAILQLGSINFYMFQGGSNFGLYNGCSDAGARNQPQQTSYDYDAPLTEWGEPTAKYFAFQQVIKEQLPDSVIGPPECPQPRAFGHFPVTAAVSLFSTLDTIAKPQLNDYPLPMELLGQSFGYVLYRTSLATAETKSQFRFVSAGDRGQLFLNQQWAATLYQETLAKPVQLALTAAENQLDILMENMGRNNYGPKLIAETQRKGIRGGVMSDLHFLADWQQFPLPLDNSSAIDFSRPMIAGTPAFYQVQLELSMVADTFLDCSSLGKGVVLVNGQIIGRYWQAGPVKSLFIPDYFWRIGWNEVIIFETEGVVVTAVSFVNRPIEEK